MKRNYLCRILAVLMVLALAMTGLVGCKKDEESKNESKVEESKQELELVTINQHVMGSEPGDCEYVLGEINKYLEASEVKVHLNLVHIPVGEYGERMGAALATGGDFDLIGADNNNLPYAQHVGSEDFLALDDLLDQYGSTIKEVVPDWALEATKVNGKIYGIPTVKDLAELYSLGWNKTMADVIGMTDAMRNLKWNFLSDLDEIAREFKAKRDADTTVNNYEDTYGSGVKTGYQELVNLPVFPFSETNMGAWWGLDTISNGVGTNVDGINFFASVEGTDTVFSAFETEEFAEIANTVGRWVDDNIMINKFTYRDYDPSWLHVGNGDCPFQISSGLMSCAPAQYHNPNTTKIYWEAECTPSQIAVGTRSYVRSCLTCIYAESKNAERAMQYMNFLWGDDFLNTAFRLGIENYHYVEIDGRAVFTDNGGPGNSGWYSWYGVGYGGDLFKCLLPKVQLDNFFDGLIELNARADKYGTHIEFDFDQEPVEAKIAAVNSPIETYKEILVGSQTPLKDVQANLDKFKAELQDAGINEIVAEAQKQLDAFLGK